MENGIILLELNHGLLTIGINLVLILLVQNWHSVEHHKDYVEKCQEVAAAPKNCKEKQTSNDNQEFLQITAMSNLPQRSKAPVDLIPQ